MIFDAPTESTRSVGRPPRAVLRAGKVVARSEPARSTVVWDGQEDVDFLR